MSKSIFNWPILQLCLFSSFHQQYILIMIRFFRLVFVNVIKHYKVKNTSLTNIFVSNFLDEINTGGVLTCMCPSLSLYLCSSHSRSVIWPPASIYSSPSAVAANSRCAKGVFFLSFSPHVCLRACVCVCVCVQVLPADCTV